MSSIVVSGDTSGAITLSAPSVSGTNTLTLPAVTDTLAGIAATQTLTNKTITSPVLSGTATGTYTLGGTPSIAGSAITGTQVIPKAALPTGAVLQVVSNTYSTQTSTVSTSYVTSGLAASITPTSSTSKVLAICSFNTYNSAGAISSYYTLYRGASNLLSADGAFRLENGSSYLLNSANISYLDSPATTSSTTYTVYMKSQTAGATTYMAFNNITCSIILLEISA